MMASAEEEVRLEYSTYVRERIEQGRREADENRIVEDEEVESRMRRWLEEFEMRANR
jgi:hypothetical protein